MEYRSDRERVFLRIISWFFSIVLVLFSAASSPTIAAESVCAQVKIEIQQELTLERQAFDAMMRINNGLDTLPIEDVNIAVNFRDENDNPVLATNDPNSTDPAAKFFIRTDSMDGIADVSGSGVVEPSSTAEVHWLIIPVPGAADGNPGGKLYFVGATLTYTLGGEQETVEVTPDFITVKPMPKLALDYFLTHDVVADDPFTAEVEPPEPYTLGLRIRNKGTGSAHNVSIDSAQPTIVENEQGLLVDFVIKGSSVDDQPSTPSLMIDFGTIPSEESRVGRWIMESTLSGEFVEFSATVSHADELGGNVTSLIDQNDLNTYYLVHNVLVDLPGRDGVRDFLAYPVGADTQLSVYESDTVDSTVADTSPSSTFVLDSTSGTESYYTLHTNVVDGFVYVKLPDPFSGEKSIKSVTRSDGKVISSSNFWNSKTRNRDTNPPSWEHWINFFDVNTTGTYVVHIGEKDLPATPPVIHAISNKTTYEGEQIGFVVEASDPNGDPVSLTASSLPSGATLQDNGDGTAFFNWTPATGQNGVYSVTFRASDGSLSATRSMTIVVNPAWDKDGDGLDDAWELEHFGNLDSDGSGDADSDGISDLDEYLDGTDPNLAPPEIPYDLTAVSGNSKAILSWTEVAGADSYHIYWSENPGVDKEQSNLIEAGSSPYTHTGINNGNTYFYALAAMGPGGESSLSPEISIVPGKFDWGEPLKLDAAEGEVTDFDIQTFSNGSIISVWSQREGSVSNLWGAYYTPDSGWSSPVRIDSNDTASVRYPQVTINDITLTATVTWVESDGIQESMLASDFTTLAGWSIPTLITSASNVNDVQQLALDNDDVTILWSQYIADTNLSTIYSATQHSGVWGAPSVVSADEVGVVSSLEVVADTNLNLQASWLTTPDGTVYDLSYSSYSTSTGWVAATKLRSAIVGDSQSSTLAAKLAMNHSGESVLVWEEAASPNSIWAARYTPASGWQSPEVIDTSDLSGAYRPDVAIGDSGDIYVVWQQQGATVAESDVYFRRFSPDAGWQTPTILSRELVNGYAPLALAPSVTTDASGNIHVGWQQSDGIQDNILVTRWVQADDVWTEPEVVDIENAGDATAAEIISGEDGDAAVGWIQSDDVTKNIWVNIYASGNDGMPNIPPVIALDRALTTDEQSAVSLSAVDSFDQDGAIADYSWRQLSGTVVSLEGANQPQASFVSPSLVSSEDLVFAVDITDDEGEVTTAEVTVTVNPVNALPLVDAGTDVVTNENLYVPLHASASDDDGDILSVLWQQISGMDVQLKSPDSLISGFDAPSVKSSEVLVFRVKVVDNEGGESVDEVTVTVEPVNHPPVVSSGEDQNVDEKSNVTLVASSYDPDSDGLIVSHAWEQISGPIVNLTDNSALTSNFVAPTVKSPVQLMFRMTAVDDEGGVGSDEVVVTVMPVNHVPQVQAGDDLVVDEKGVVTLSGVVSDPDEDGVIVSYSWSQVGGESVSLNTPDLLSTNFVAPTTKVASELLFRLTAVDDEGGVSSDDIKVTVNPVNHPPEVDAGEDLVVDERESVNLSVSANDPDADGVIEVIAWEQIAGSHVVINNADMANSNFMAPTLKVAEVLEFRAVVTDDEGGVSSDEMKVTVNPVNHLPVVDAGQDSTADEGTSVTLSATAVDPDDDGEIVSYLWEQIDGPTVDISTGLQSREISFTTPLVYQETLLGFNVDVEDDEGGIVSDTVYVTVISTNPDDDADGMDDLWEIDWFGNLDRDGAGDFDGDGATDLMEFEFGSDPTVQQGPGQPMLLSPDNAEVLSLSPMLTLQNGDHHKDFSVTYQFEIYSDPAMTKLVASSGAVEEGTDTTSWMPEAQLMDNTHYYWRGRADGWVLYSDWVSGEFFVNTANDAPGDFRISSPQDGVWVDTFTPNLSVTNSTDIDEDVLTYAFTVYPYGDVGGAPIAGASDVAEGDAGTTDWFVDIPLNENTWYSWNSVVTDEHGATATTETAAFFVNTVNDAPTAPAIISPIANSELTMTETSLLVANASDPDSSSLSYTFEIDTAETFDSANLVRHPGVPEGPDSTEWYVSGLSDNTWYYWRAKSSDGMAESEWNSSRFFVNTANDAPSIPVPENPGDGGWAGTLSPSLSVYPSQDVDFDTLSYEFEVFAADRRKRVAELVASGNSETTSWQIEQPLMYPGWYYWRAQAVDEHGATSGWSEAVLFFADSDGVNDAPTISLRKLSLNRTRGHERGNNHAWGDDGCKRGWDDRRSQWGDHRRPDRCDPDDTAIIRWRDADPDSNAEISLYYDTDRNGEDGVLIADGIMEDPDGRGDSYRWDVTQLPAGIYFVYAVIDDGMNQHVAYTELPLVIGDGGGRPYIELQKPDKGNGWRRNKITLSWDDVDSDSNAVISLYYSSEQQSSSGTPIATGLEENPDGRMDVYHWDVRDIQDGEYYLYAVITDGSESFVHHLADEVRISRHDHGRGRDQWGDKPNKDKEKGIQDLLKKLMEKLRELFG